MIIKFIPETQVEKEGIFRGEESITHSGVKDYFVMGSKLDEDGSLIDFHEWNGAYRYLVSNLGYFYEVINDERKASEERKAKSPRPQIQKTNNVMDHSKGLFKRSEMTDITPININKPTDDDGLAIPFKKGTVTFARPDIDENVNLTIDDINRLAKKVYPQNVNEDDNEMGEIPQEEKELNAEDLPINDFLKIDPEKL